MNSSNILSQVEGLIVTESTLEEIKATFKLLGKVLLSVVLVVAAIIYFIIESVNSIRNQTNKVTDTNTDTTNNTQENLSTEDTTEVSNASVDFYVVNDSYETEEELIESLTNVTTEDTEEEESIPQVFPNDILEWGHCTDEGVFYPVQYLNGELVVEIEGEFFSVIKDEDNETGEVVIAIITNPETRDGNELYHRSIAEQWFGNNLVLA